MAFYTYSNEKYEPCMFRNGTFVGTPEEAFEIAAIYLKALKTGATITSWLTWHAADGAVAARAAADASR